MGKAERKERDSVEMKRRIIDVALKMFVEEGYEKSSIRNLAEKIEYSPSTLYLYYKDKDELLFDVQKECFEKLDAEFLKKAKAKDPFERLKQICHTYVRYGIDHPEGGGRGGGGGAPRGGGGGRGRGAGGGDGGE